MKAEELSVLLIEDDDIEMGVGLLCLKQTGIKRIDKAKNEFQAIRNLQSYRYNLIISDTDDTTNYPFGPEIIRRAKSLGQSAVVVGISNYKGNSDLWQGLADYFFEKHTFYKEGLQQVLSERFGI